MTRVWRITTVAFVQSAFDGEGARLYGGRWNSPGMPLVYCAATMSLAILEMMVQDQPLRAHYNLVPAIIPDEMHIETIAVGQLPKNWRRSDGVARLREIGGEWLASGRSAVLRVPSAVLPLESNFLIDPRHADFRRIETGRPESLDMDSRLLRKAALRV